MKLRRRSGYLSKAAAPQPLEWSQERWNEVALSPLGSIALPIDVKCELISEGNIDSVRLVMQLKAEDLHFQPDGDQLKAEIEVAMVDKTPEGKHRTQRSSMQVIHSKDEPNQTIHLRHSWQPAPDTSTIRLIVRDKLTGRYGVLDLPIKQIPRQGAGDGPKPRPS